MIARNFRNILGSIVNFTKRSLTNKTIFFQTQSEEYKEYVQAELQILRQIPDFESAMKNVFLKRYDLAKENLESVLKEIQEKEELDPFITMLVMKKYGILLRTLNNSEELTKLLEEMFFINFANTEYDSLAFLPTVHNLITHYCYQDVHKGKAFSQLILEENSKKPIPDPSMGEIYVLLGNIETLYGKDYDSGIDYYKKSLESSLSEQSKIMAKNNMIFATFWGYIDKIKKLKIEIPENASISDEKLYLRQKTAEKELLELETNYKSICEESIMKLKEIVFYLECEDEKRAEDQLTTIQFLSIKSFLNPKEVYPDIKKILLRNLVIKNERSPKLLMGIAELFFRLGNTEQTLFWLQLCLEYATKLGVIKEVLRGMTMMASITEFEQEKDEKVETLYLDCLEYSTKAQGFNLTFCLECYSMFLRKKNRNYEADEYFAQALNLRANSKPWEEKFENLMIDDYNFAF